MPSTIAAESAGPRCLPTPCGGRTRAARARRSERPGAGIAARPTRRGARSGGPPARGRHWAAHAPPPPPARAGRRGAQATTRCTRSEPRSEPAHSAAAARGRRRTRRGPRRARPLPVSGAWSPRTGERHPPAPRTAAASRAHLKAHRERLRRQADARAARSAGRCAARGWWRPRSAPGPDGDSGEGRRARRASAGAGAGDDWARRRRPGYPGWQPRARERADAW